jgi:hypothetical protein
MCCGSKRAAAQLAAMAAQSARGTAPSTVQQPHSASAIVFEYTGTRAVEVIVGPMTRRLYRFDGPGARVRVDARDRPGLMSLSLVRWVR